MKLKKWLGMLLSLMMIAAVGVGISACGTHVVTTEYVTVTWYDGTTAIKTNDKHVKGVTIGEKEFPSEEELHKEGYTFENWYKDLQCTAEFDFAQKITANTNIYGKWTKGEEPPVDTHTHSYGNWTVTLKPTLEQEGRAERTCTAADCDNSANKTEGKVLPKLSEAESYTIDHTKPAKCNEKGLDTYTLKAETSISFTVDVDMAEHNYGTLIAEQPATCTSEGTHAHYHCDVCNQDFLQVEGKPASTPANPEQLKIEKLDHKMHEHAADPADCQKAGTLKYYTCEYEEGVYYADEEGTETLEDITDPKKDHTYEGAEWHHDASGHWQVCTMCETQESEHQEHDTKGKDGVEGACSVCGYVKETVEHTHTYGDWQITKPTTEREGSAERTCNDPQCDHSEGETETKVLPKLSEADKYIIDHTEEPDCEKTGTDKYTLNEDDSIFFDVEVPATGHTYGDPTWEWVEDEGGDGYASATATFTCKKNDKTETVTVEKAQIKVEDKTNQCTTDKIYTATVHFGEKDYTDTKTKNIQGSHNLELVSVKEATCTQTGTKAHYECQTCHKLFDEHDQTKEVQRESLVIQAKGHQFSPWKVELKPEENTVGRATRECTKCEDEAGRTEEIELPELSKADKYDIVHTQEPGCTEDGTYTYTLKEVKEISFEVTIEKLGHDMTMHAAKDATCTKDGNELYYTCNHEGDDKIYKDDEGAETWESLEATVRHATGHSYGEWEITPPTKDGKGSATKTCQNCGAEEPDHTITVELPALDSDEATAYVKGVDTATCTEAGKQEYTLENENGDITFEVDTPVKAHTYSKWEHDDTNHWQKCDVCQEETDHEPHTFDNGYCATCDAYEKYTLTFDLGDASATGDKDPIEVYADNATTHLHGAPKRDGFNFTGWLCDADKQTYGAGDEYIAKGNAKFTAQWEPVSANECPYDFYITGNGAGDLSRSGGYSLVREFCMKKSMSGTNTVYTYELKIYKGDNFKIATNGSNSKLEASTWYGFDQLSGGNAKTEFERNETDNIGAKAYGKYKVTLTVNKAGTCQSLTIDKLETYTGTSQFKGWYVTGTIVDPQWKQAPTEYELTLSGSNYIGFFKFDVGAAFKVIKVNATIVNGDEVGYTAEWHSPSSGANSDGNYEVKATGWYKVQIANSTSTSTMFYVYTATEHTHNYTWNVTLEPTEGSTGTVTGTCQNKSTGSTQVPCDKPEVTLTLPELKEENGYTVTGNHSCTAQYTLHYKVTLQDEDENSYEVEFDLTHDADPHVTDGTWQSDAVHHWHKCENCETHVDEAEHTFKDHVCSECEYHAKKVTAHFALGYETEETVGDEVEYADDKSETITLPTPEDRVGYEFNGWLLDGKGEPEKETHTITFGDTDTELNFTAKWTAIVYTVKFASTVEGATLPETPATTSLEANTTFTLTALTLKGYEFLGWFVNGAKLDQQEADYLFELTAEKIGTEGFVGDNKTITITAQWKANEYTVVFAHDPATVDGENVTNMPTVNGKITVEDGKNTITLTKPVREGYTFVNWVRGNGDAVTIGEEGTATYTLTAEKLPSGDTITFTAKWTENDYHVTYDLKGGTVTSGTIEDTKVYHVRGTVTISNVEPTRTGYTFDGWKVKGGDDTVYKKDGAHTTYTMKAEDVTFEAQWTAKEYTIVFNVNKPVDAEGTISESPENQEHVTLEAGTINLPTLSGLTTHDFAGWRISKSGGSLITGESTTLTEEMINNEAEGVITLYASWTVHGKVTAHFAYGAGIQENPDDQSVTSGAEITFPQATVTRTGYEFKGWRKSDEPQGEIHTADTKLAITEETTFNAVWEAIKYKIVLGDKETLTDVTLENAQVFAAPEARKGYRFDGWKFNGVKYEKLTAKLIEAANPTDDAHTITLEAAWTAIDYTIKLQVTQPKEGVEVEPVEPEQVTGALTGDHTKFTLPTPTAPTGYKFDGWKLSESKTLEAGENTFSEDMIPEKGEEITLKTNWSLIEYKIVFTGATHDPITGVTLDTADGHTFPTKDTITKTGYEFAGWKLEGHVDVGDPTYTKLTTELIEKAKPADPENAITLVAQWTSVKYTVVYSAGVEEEIEVPTDGNTYALDGTTTITVAEMTGTRTGYDFKGWKLPGQEEVLSEETFTLDETLIGTLGGKTVITLTAEWTKHQYTVTFTSTVSTPAPESVKVEYQGTLKLGDYTIEDTKDQHFLGWAYQDSSDELISDDTITITEDVTLVAVWEAKILVTFEIEGQENETVYVVKGQPIPEEAYPKNPTKEGDYRFDNWYKVGEETAYDREDTVSESFTLEARFIKQIHITYFDEYNDALSTKNETIDENTAAKNATNADKKGYEVHSKTIDIWESEWYLDEARTQKYSGGDLADDTTLYRNWVEIVGTKATTANQKYLLIGSVSPLEWRYDDNSGNYAGLFKRDTTLQYHEVYTITFKFAKGDFFRIRKSGTGWNDGSDIRADSSMSNAHMSGTLMKNYFKLRANDNDSNFEVTKAGIYKFVIIIDDSTYHWSLEYFANANVEESYYLVGSMTNWADIGCTPIYLGKASTAKNQTLTTDVEITAEDYGWKDSTHRYTFATAKVVVGYTYKGHFLMVSNWDATTNLETDTNFHFPEGTGNFRVTFTVSNSTSHTGTLAVQKEEIFTFEFSLGDAEGVVEDYDLPQSGSVNSLDGAKVTMPATDPTWEGHRFLGWKIDGVEDLKHQNDTVILTKSVTITAQWIEQFEVSFSADEKDGGDVPAGGLADKGNYEIPAGEPTRTGYTFAGWYVGETYQEGETTLYKNGDEEHSSYELTDATIFKAAWNAIEYTVKFVTEHGSVEEKTVTLDSPEIDLTKEPYKLEQKGYTFKGWQGIGVADSKFILTKELIIALQEDAFTLTAQWEAISYTVEFDTTTGKLAEMGDVTLPDDVPTSVSLTEPEITLPALSMEGFIFKGWHYHDESDRNGKFTLTEELLPEHDTVITFTMHWEVKPQEEQFYKYTYDLNGPEGVAPEGGTASSNDDYRVTLTDTRPEWAGHNFLGWKVGETNYDSGATDVVIPNDNYVIEAQWETIEYTATFSIGDHAADTVNEEDYPAKTVTIDDDNFAVTLPAAPAAERGYKFVNWSWEEGGQPKTGDPQDTINLSDNVTITAQYEALTEITVTWHVDNQVHGEVETYYEGETLNVPEISEKYGFTFDGWYQSAACTGNKFTTSAKLGSSPTILNLYGKYNLISDSRTYYITGFGGGAVNTSNNKTFTAGQFTKGTSTTANTYTLSKVLLIYGDTIDIRYGTAINQTGTLAVAAKALYTGNTSVFDVSSSTTGRATVNASGYYNITLTTLCKDSTTTSERQYTIKFTKTSEASVSGYWIVGSMTSNGTWGSTQSPVFVSTSISTTYTRIVKVTTSSQYGDSSCDSGCHAGEVKVVKATYSFDTNTLDSIDWGVYYQDGNYWCAEWSVSQNKHINTIGTFTLTIKASGSKVQISSHTYSSSTT